MNNMYTSKEISKSTSDSNADLGEPKTILYPYHIVCKECNKTIYFSGVTDQKTYVLCDRCAHLQ
ncbi:hypothetical protein ACPUYX_06350 [Desulfosporosinus sp. SYSU MS00001]|uniref:hypothetical protein n=1 Tax=Desulfosporosinus sp. SYSU MS00001 TaxID=3416284 RepID=UPI003CEA5290